MAVKVTPICRILRRPEVQRRTGVGCSTIYELIKKKAFPRPVSLGAKSVGWVESEIDEWLAARIAERDNANGGSKA
jgi:prophage regulatory protein